MNSPQRKEGLAVHREEVGEYLVADSRVCHGKLTFKGTRVPVETVLRAVARGETFAEILEGWPELSRPAVTEAVRLAAMALVKKHFHSFKIPA
jgi:uncharacterized protein (DUF433 family)